MDTPKTADRGASPLILFDGVCNLCNSSVQFIIRHDRKRVFKFASLQYAFANDILDRKEVNADSVVLLRSGVVLTKSSAIFKIACMMGWPYKIIGVFSILPTSFTDYCYDIIARSRYRIFGKRDSCMVPTPELKGRFLDS